MRNLIKKSVLVLAFGFMAQAAHAAEEVKFAPAFNSFKGAYVLQKAKGPRKKYCEQTIEVAFTRSYLDRQIFTVASVLPKVNFPVANMTKHFAEPGGCESVQNVRLNENAELRTVTIDETVKTLCPNKKNSSYVTKAINLDEQSKVLTFSLIENGRLKAMCQWSKK